MPTYRSRTTTHGRNMAGARSLWRATGMTDDDFDKAVRTFDDKWGPAIAVEDDKRYWFAGMASS